MKKLKRKWTTYDVMHGMPVYARMVKHILILIAASFLIMMLILFVQHTKSEMEPEMIGPGDFNLPTNGYYCENVIRADV